VTRHSRPFRYSLAPGWHGVFRNGDAVNTTLGGGHSRELTIGIIERGTDRTTIPRG
jgi:hypothetical protein